MFLSAYAVPLVARNNAGSIAARRLMEREKNITSAESLVVFDDGAVEFNDTDATSRRNLGATKYHKYSGRDRSGGDIGACGRWTSEEAIRNECTRLRYCIGYTTLHGRPWCLKSTHSSSNMYKTWGHHYYAKDSDKCPTEPGRCGPKFRGAFCTGGILRGGGDLYCNEDNGWCGPTWAHQNAQPSTKYDGPAYLECREKYGWW